MLIPGWSKFPQMLPHAMLQLGYKKSGGERGYASRHRVSGTVGDQQSATL
jgi:hypothetical protein